MIFGRDPQNPEKVLTKETTAKVASEVLDYFNFTARKNFSSAVPTHEQPIFRKHINRLLNSGLDAQALRWYTTVFFARYPNRACPWKSFVSRDIQQVLHWEYQQHLGAPGTDDPVLAWILNDFERTSDLLPWDECADQQVQTLVLNHTNVLFRYPELVAEVLFDLAEEPDDAEEVLGLLSDLVAIRLAKSDKRPVVSALRSWGVALPDSLAGAKPLREQATSLAAAVLEATHTTRRT